MDDEMVDKVLEAVTECLVNPFGMKGGDLPPLEFLIDRRALRMRLEAL